MIHVFGSINLDLVASVAALPRPGETTAAGAFRTTPGGKGANQALAARRAGARVAVHGAVGRDAFAAPALAALRDAGVDVAGVREVDAPTGLALIHVDERGENCITIVPGANAHATSAPIPDADLTGAIVLMQLEVPLPEVAALAARARDRGARVVLNAAPAMPLPPGLVASIEVLVVNEHEAATVGGAMGLPVEPAPFARELSRRGVRVVVTLGPGGAIACVDGAVSRATSPAVDVVDTVGAGDAFCGALAASLDRGASLPDALPFAVAAGALACTRAGAQEAMPARDAIDRLLGKAS